MLTSFDSIVREEMNTIRGGDVYDRVASNYRDVAALKSAQGSKMLLWAIIVFQKENLNSVFETIDYLLADMGVDRVLVQPCIPGNTYRFLVIANQVVAAARLVPPSVTGDGRHKVAELVAKLNADPRRDIGDMLIAGFALAAGAGMFHGVVWMVKRLAKTSVEADSVIVEEF